MDLLLFKKKKKEKKTFGFIENNLDQCIYLKINGNKFIVLILHAENILLASNDLGILRETRDYHEKNFDIKDMGEATSVACNRN